jgi:arylformamidase
MNMSTDRLVYRQYTQEELDRQYNVRRGIPNFQAYFDRFCTLAEAFRRSVAIQADLPYGDHPLQTLDYFPAAAGAERAPLLLFIHGGYWRSLDKSDFSHVAASFVAAGINVALINYRLAPQATMDEITGDCRAALHYLVQQASSLRFDPNQMHLAGHSAGGHLTAALAGATASQPDAFPALRSICCISGLYDLQPVALSYLNQDLHLREAEIDAHSPLQHLPATTTQVILTVGGRESDAFHDQQHRYAQALTASGMTPRIVTLPAAHHLDVIDVLADGNSELTRAMHEAIQACRVKAGT